MVGGDGTKIINSRSAYILFQSAVATTCYLNNGTYAGLYLRASIANTDDFNAAYSGPRITIPIYDLTGLTAQQAVEQWAMIMFTQPHVPNANYEFARIGVQQWPAPGDTNSTYRRAMLGKGWNTTGVRTAEMRAASLTTNAGSTSVMALSTDDVYAFRILTDGWVEMYAGQSVAGNFPSVAALRLIASVGFRAVSPGLDALSINGAHSDTFQWAITCNVTTGNTAGNSSLLLQKIQVLYR